MTVTTRQVAAAKLRVAADRKSGTVTPEIIQKIARATPRPQLLHGHPSGGNTSQVPQTHA